MELVEVGRSFKQKERVTLGFIGKGKKTVSFLRYYTVATCTNNDIICVQGSIC